MVVIFLPAAAATGSTQERTALPSRCTVHAPHWAIPQPYFTPVIPHRSRSAQSSGISSGASTSRVWPFSSSFMGGLRWLRSITSAAANGRHGTIESLPNPMSQAADRWRISTWASTMTRMTQSRNSLAAGIALLAPQEGGNETRYPGVSLYRFHGPGAAHALRLSLQPGSGWGRKEAGISGQQDASVRRGPLPRSDLTDADPLQDHRFGRRAGAFHGGRDRARPPARDGSRI